MPGCHCRNHTGQRWKKIKIWRSKNMTSYDFEKAAKNAVRKDLEE